MPPAPSSWRIRYFDSAKREIPPEGQREDCRALQGCQGFAKSGRYTDRTVRLLALDVGDVRIGVAVSDETGTLASGLATLRSLGPDSGVELAVAGRLGQVVAVPEQLQQVVLNLVLNARRALERAESTAPVGVRLSGEDGRVRLEVADTGPGIPPERLRTLFQPFQSGGGGFGIGLYESKRIVESYRGTLRVESEVGRGTRVVVELPAESRLPG